MAASLKVSFSFDSEPGVTNRIRRPSSSTLLSDRRKSTARKPSTLLSPTWQNGGDNQSSPQRRMSRVGRNHFLRSFGKDTLYGYEGVEEVLPERTDDLADKPQINVLLESVREDDKKEDVKAEPVQRVLRAVSARSPSDSKWLYKDILQDRGNDYTADDGDIRESLKEKIRSQSAKRRIRRIMLADKEKAEAEVRERKNDQKKKRTLKGTTISLLALKATTGTFDMFMEKKKWLTDTRMRKKKLVS